MNSATLVKSAIALASFAGAATGVHAATPRDVDDLVGVRASSGESALERRGYRFRKTIKVAGSSITYWWNPQQQTCIAVTTADGRYKSIATQPEAVCSETNSAGAEAPPGGYGRPIPQITKVDNDNVAVDLGGCNVLFNPRGGIVNQGASCSGGDVRKARDAFTRYVREQNAPAGAEAPPGGFGGQGGTATVTCESSNGGYQFCRQSIGSNAQVRLKRRLSGRCTQGESWGYDADGVWVDKGCRAVFEIR